MKQTIDRCYQTPRDSVARGEVGEIWKGISVPSSSAFQTDFAKRSVSRPIDGSEEGGVMGRQSSGGIAARRFARRVRWIADDGPPDPPSCVCMLQWWGPSAGVKEGMNGE